MKEPVPSNRYAGGWFGEQRMTRMEAIRAFTIWPARAAGLEKTMGSLEAGKHADFVVLSTDITTVPDAGLLSTEVLETWVGGKKAWPLR